MDMLTPTIYMDTVAYVTRYVVPKLLASKNLFGEQMGKTETTEQ